MSDNQKNFPGPQPETYWERRSIIAENIMAEIFNLLMSNQAPYIQEHYGNLLKTWDDAVVNLNKNNEQS